MLYDTRRRWWPRRVVVVGASLAMGMLQGIVVAIEDRHTLLQMRDVERRELGLPPVEDEPIGFWRVR